MSFLEILAECSIALVGFGAVHAALQGSHGPRGMFRAWTVVLHGAIAFVLSVLPLLLALSSLSHDQMWRGASMVGVAFAGLAVYVNVGIDVRMNRMGHPPQAKKLIRTAQGLSIVALLAMFSNAIALPASPDPFLYAMATMLLLFVALIAILHSFLVPLEIFFDSAPQNKNQL